MGDAAVAKARTWQLMIAPWSEAQRAALRRFGNDESSVLLSALRTDGGKLEFFVTCKAPRRAAWLSTNAIEGEWRPAASPKTKGERCNLLAQYQECCDRSNQGQRANVPASAASPARPPKDREGLQAARPPEDREDLGLPPLAAVSIEPRQLAPAPSPASMFSLSPAQRTAAESAAAERAAAEEAKERAAAERAAKKARRAERERRMCEEGERALWHEAARASTTWRRVHDPSDDEGGPPCPEACEPLFEALIEAQDKVGDEAGDEVGEEAEDHDEDHDETNRSLNRFGASRSANSSAAHSIAASPFHAIPSRSIRSIWDGRMWHERTAHEIWDGRMSGRRMRWAHDPNTGPFLLEVSPTDPSIWDGRNGWDGRARY